ncbi:hypothetical protein C8J57DRAFT_1520699 [Mycena rebaudengoi]|nr:hypothetical protein C8J57DRAFT_1520699 [Mycena rebaudengoi]
MPYPSEPATVLPPFALGSEHTYAKLVSQPANRFVYRVHSSTGDGALIPSVGFVASRFLRGTALPTSSELDLSQTHTQLVRDAYSHVLQWKYPGADSFFVSASFSIAYALHEAGRRNAATGSTNTQISVIDTSRIGVPALLATQLVGASDNEAAFFARRAQEILVCALIPETAVVFTAPLDIFLHFLPRWCDHLKPAIRHHGYSSTSDRHGPPAGPRALTRTRTRKNPHPWSRCLIAGGGSQTGTDGSTKILESDPYPYPDRPVPGARRGWPDPCRSLSSTEDCAYALANAALNPGNDSPEEHAVLLRQSVARSLLILQDMLPETDQHEPDAEAVARFAAIFCWWPRWIINADPTTYHALLMQVRWEVDTTRTQASLAKLGSICAEFALTSE